MPGLSKAQSERIRWLEEKRAPFVGNCAHVTPDHDESQAHPSHESRRAVSEAQPANTMIKIVTIAEHRRFRGSDIAARLDRRFHETARNFCATRLHS
jgi:hypothetical protein